MKSTPYSAKIDDIDIILTVSDKTISAKATKDDRSLFEISLYDVILCSNQTNNVILNWNSGNTISSAIITSRHAREIARKIQESV